MQDKIITRMGDGASGIVAKCRIADLLNIELSSVTRFKSKLDIAAKRHKTHKNKI